MPSIQDRLKKLLSRQPKEPKSRPHETFSGHLPEEVEDPNAPGRPMHQYYDFVMVAGSRLGPDGETQGAYAIAKGKSGDIEKHPLPQFPNEKGAVFIPNGTAGVVKSMGARSIVVEFTNIGWYHMRREDLQQYRPPEERALPGHQASVRVAAEKLSLEELEFILEGARQHANYLTELEKSADEQTSVALSNYKMLVARGQDDERAAENVNALALRAKKIHDAATEKKQEADRISIDLRTWNRYGPEAIDSNRMAEYVRLARLRKSSVRVAVRRTPQELIELVRSKLSPDLLKREWQKKHERGECDPMTGYCYVASEALAHLLGPKYRPKFIRHEGAPHWFLLGPDGEVIDPTSSQFRTPVPYEQAKGKGFLTKKPSARTRELLKRMKVKRGSIRMTLQAFLRMAGPERVNYLMQKYPGYKPTIEYLSQMDPTGGQQAYLEWMFRQSLKWQKENPESWGSQAIRGAVHRSMAIAVDKFHELKKHLSAPYSKDINQYKSVDDLSEKMTAAQEQLAGILEGERVESMYAGRGEAFKYALREFMRADPSGKNEYLGWAMSQFDALAKGATNLDRKALVRTISDLYGRYHHLKSREEELVRLTDGEGLEALGSFSVGGLESYLSKIESALGEAESAPDLAYETDYGAKIFGPIHSKAQLCAHGTSNWCVARWSSKFFEDQQYMGNEAGDPHFFIIEDEAGDRFLAFVRYGAVQELADESDRHDVDASRFTELFEHVGVKGDAKEEVFILRFPGDDTIQYADPNRETVEMHASDDTYTRFGYEIWRGLVSASELRRIAEGDGDYSDLVAEQAEFVFIVEPDYETRWVVIPYEDAHEENSNLDHAWGVFPSEEDAHKWIERWEARLTQTGWAIIAVEASEWDIQNEPKRPSAWSIKSEYIESSSAPTVEHHGGYKVFFATRMVGNHLAVAGWDSDVNELKVNWPIYQGDQIYKTTLTQKEMNSLQYQRHTKILTDKIQSQNAEFVETVGEERKPENLSTPRFNRDPMVEKEFKPVPLSLPVPETEEGQLGLPLTGGLRLKNGSIRVRVAEDLPAVQSLKWHGFNIAIESRGGETRMADPKFPQPVPESWGGIGYFEGIPAEDGDSLDVIIGPESEHEMVYLVSQKDMKTDEFIQFKVMLGFASEAAAEAGFKVLWPEQMFADIVAFPADEFVANVMEKLVASEKEAAGIIDLKGLDDTVTDIIVDAIQQASDSKGTSISLTRATLPNVAGEVERLLEHKLNDKSLAQLLPKGTEVLRDKRANETFLNFIHLGVSSKLSSNLGGFHPKRGLIFIHVRTMLHMLVLRQDKRKTENDELRWNTPLELDLQTVRDTVYKTVAHELRHAADWAYQTPGPYERESYPRTRPEMTYDEVWQQYINTPTELKSHAGDAAAYVYQHVGSGWRDFQGDDLTQLIHDVNPSILGFVAPENRKTFLQRVVKALEQLDAKYGNVKFGSVRVHASGRLVTAQTSGNGRVWNMLVQYIGHGDDKELRLTTLRELRPALEPEVNAIAQELEANLPGLPFGLRYPEDMTPRRLPVILYNLGGASATTGDVRQELEAFAHESISPEELQDAKARGAEDLDSMLRTLSRGWADRITSEHPDLVRAVINASEKLETLYEPKHWVSFALQPLHEDDTAFAFFNTLEAARGFALARRENPNSALNDGFRIVRLDGPVPKVTGTGALRTFIHMTQGPFVGSRNPSQEVIELSEFSVILPQYYETAKKDVVAYFDPEQASTHEEYGPRGPEDFVDTGDEDEDGIKHVGDQVPGGLGDDEPDSAFDPKELEMGIKDETEEHTDDPAVGKEIAKDHLAKDPKYYSHMQETEQQS